LAGKASESRRVRERIPRAFGGGEERRVQLKLACICCWGENRPKEPNPTKGFGGGVKGGSKRVVRLDGELTARRPLERRGGWEVIASAGAVKQPIRSWRKRAHIGDRLNAKGEKEVWRRDAKICSARESSSDQKAKVKPCGLLKERGRVKRGGKVERIASGRSRR